MAVYEDRVCQWCKATLAIATDKDLVEIADFQEFEGKAYCTGRSGNCWDNLLAMAQYVNDGFSDDGPKS